MTKVKTQSRTVSGAKEGMGLELKMDLSQSQVSTFCRMNVNRGCFH